MSWISIKGEDHGLNSQPGDVWREDGHKPSVLSELLDRPFAQHIRLKKDMPFFIEYHRPFKDTPNVWVIKAGEEAEYFEHTDCYLFMTRDGHVPYFSRVVLARLPEFVEAI